MEELEQGILRLSRPIIGSLTEHGYFGTLGNILIAIVAFAILSLVADIIVGIAKFIASKDFYYFTKGLAIQLRHLRSANPARVKPPRTKQPVRLDLKRVFLSASRRIRPLISKNTRLGLIPPSILLLMAWLDNWPYNFYILLRWTVCLSAAHFTYSVYLKKQFVWVFPMASVCLLFNPFAPFRFDRETWATFNAVTAAVLLFAAATGASNATGIPSETLA